MAGGDDLVPEDGYRRRRGWDKAKKAIGCAESAEQLARLERCHLGCPRLLLCACIDGFLRMSPEDRLGAVTAYLASMAFPRSELIPAADRSPEEALACEAEFLAAMERVMAEAGA